MKNLREKTINSFKWDFSGAIVGQIVTFSIGVILARLLSPEEFGLVAMSMVFIHFFYAFVDGGFGAALIQNKKNTPLTYSSVFYLNIFISIVAFILIQLFAVYIGEFYGSKKVVNILRVAAIYIPINSLSIVQTTILKKNLRFKYLTVRLLISQVISGVIGIICAFNGLGVYALVIQSLVAATVITVSVWYITEWKPDFNFSIIEIKKLFGFSSYYFLSTLVNSITDRINIVFIGKVFSAQNLGFYGIADSLRYKVISFSSNSIYKVFFPVLSLIKDDQKKFHDTLLKVFNLVSLVSFFLMGALYIMGEAIINNVYGAKWEPSVFIFEILILGSFSYPLNGIMQNAIISKGYSKQYFYLVVINRLLQVIIIIIGYIYGFNAFLYSIVALNLISCFLHLGFLSNYIQVSFFNYFSIILKGIIFVYPLLLIKSYLSISSNEIINSIIYVLIFSGLYFFYAMFFHKDTFNYTKDLVIERLQKK